MASKSKKRVVKYRRRHSLNIGIIIFALVFIYILFYVGSYFARDKVSIYEVVEGKSAVMSNRSYTGFAKFRICKLLCKKRFPRVKNHNCIYTR